MARPKHKERPLIVIDAGDQSQRPFWMAIVEVARKNDWQLFNTNASKGRLPVDVPIAGAICAEFADGAIVKSLRERGCCCVRHGKYPNQFDDVLPAVYPDRRAAGRLAAEHFAARGYKNIGEVVNEPRANWDDTYEGFRDRASELGLELHLLKRLPGGNPVPLDEALSAWLSELPKPIGILAYHEYLAARIYLAAQEVGVLVPQEVAILAVGDSHLSELNPVPISTIEEDHAAAGREAALLLKRMLDGEAAPRSIPIPPKRIVLRQSTDVLAVPDLTVAKALSYIWEYYTWPLTVDDVALEVQVSRSTLERRFRRHLGRGVKAELQRKRLERCSELLQTTSMSVAELMKACGFRHRGYLHRAFRNEFGMTPGEYRRRGLTGDGPADWPFRDRAQRNTS